METDVPSETAVVAPRTISEPLPHNSAASNDELSSGSAEQEVQNSATSILQDSPWKSRDPAPSNKLSLISKRRFTHLPVKKRSTTYCRREISCKLKAYMCLRYPGRYYRRFLKCPLDTLYEIPSITGDSEAACCKHQKHKRSVEEVDQLMMNLVLQKEQQENS